MITITDREYKILTQINYIEGVGLTVLEDEFTQPENSLLSTYTFSFVRRTAQAKDVSVGCFAFAQDGSEIRCFEIMETQDEDDIRTVYCMDAGVDLINEEKGPIDEQSSQTLVYYLNSILFDSGWEIGVNHIPTTRTRKLKYDSTESSVKRLKKVADDFNAEIKFSYIVDGDTVVRKVIEVFEKGRINEGYIVLEYGQEVSSITKTENIYNLATALYSYGEDGVSLKGFNVPQEDSKYWTVIDGVLIHKPSTQKWSRHKHDINGYILAHYESTSKTQERLYQETKNQLLKRSIPELTFDIEISKLPEKVRRGYKVAVIAHDYNPAITIEATISAVEGVSFADNKVGTAKITNVEQLNIPPLEKEIEALKERFNSQLSNWNNTPHVLTIGTSNGNIFQNNNISTTLIAKVTKNDIDVTNTFTRFMWERVSRYNTTGDADFKREGVSISINKDDVDNEARFICKAYINDELKVQNNIVIKDFVMTTHKGTTPPQNADTGTLWVDTSSMPEVTKIYDNGQWVPMTTSHSLEAVKEEINENIANALSSQSANIISTMERAVEATKELITEDVNAGVERSLDTLKREMNNDFENVLAPIRERQQLLESETKAKLILELSNTVIKEYEKFVALVQENKQASEAALLDALQRLAIQETNFGAFKNQWNFLDGFMSFSNEGLMIGSKESSTSILVKNDGITIFSNGTAAATFQEGYMKIDNGIFTRTVQVGTKWRVVPYYLNDDILTWEHLGGGITNG